MPEEDDSPDDETRDELEALAMPSARARALMLIAFITTYTVACCLPTFYMTGQETVWHGVELMALGIMSLKLGQTAWLANFLAVAALRCAMSGQTKALHIISALTLLFACHTLALYNQEISIGKGDFNVVRLVAFGPGFYVWILALLMPLISNHLRHLFESRQPLPSESPAP